MDLDQRVQRFSFDTSAFERGITRAQQQMQALNKFTTKAATGQAQIGGAFDQGLATPSP